MIETSQTRFPNANCPACGRQIGPDDAIRSCLSCETTYHQTCWEANAGCASAKCAARAAEKKTARPTHVAPATGRRPRTPAAPPQAPPRASPPDSNWTAAWLTAFGLLVVACVILTIVVGVTATKRKQARRELLQLIEVARSNNDAQKLVDALDEYLLSPRTENLKNIAVTELAQARAEIEERDYQNALKPERGPHTDLDSLEAALLAYLDKHPDGGRRLEISERLALIPVRRDDRVFAGAQAKALAAGGDLGLEEGAWRTYLDDYPHGLHAAQARAEIERIPDKHEERRLTDAFAQAEALVEANRLTDALLRLDQAAGEVLAPARHERIRNRAAAIETRLAASDSEKCLGPMPENDAARAAATARCRLYLLCYPNGAEREKVARRLRTIHEQARDERLAELREKLTSLDDDPAAALRELHEFRSYPSADEIDLSSELIRFHMKLLSRAVADSLAGMKVVTLTDGTVFVGAVSPVSKGWQQIKPRAVGDEDSPKARLVKDTDATSADPPLLLEMEHLREAVSGRPLAATITAIRSTMRLVENPAYQPERSAFLVCLAGLDPTDADARSALAAANYVEHDGVFTSVADLATLGAADGQSPHQQKLAFYAAYCKNAASEQSMLALLANSFKHSFLGKTLNVPIAWTIGEPECRPTLLSGTPDHFNAELEYIYPATARRTADGALPPSVESELDQELRRISLATKITMTCEARAASRHLDGVGFDTRRQGADLVVNRVFDGGDAAEKGILPGDRVVFVENVPLGADATDETLSIMIANNPSSAVEIVFLREGRRFRVLLERRGYTTEYFQIRTKTAAAGSLVKEEDAEKEVTEWIDVPAPS